MKITLCSRLKEKRQNSFFFFFLPENDWNGKGIAHESWNCPERMWYRQLNTGCVVEIIMHFLLSRVFFLSYLELHRALCCSPLGIVVNLSCWITHSLWFKLVCYLESNEKKTGKSFSLLDVFLHWRNEYIDTRILVLCPMNATTFVRTEGNYVQQNCLFMCDFASALHNIYRVEFMVMMKKVPF